MKGSAEFSGARMDLEFSSASYTHPAVEAEIGILERQRRDLIQALQSFGQHAAASLPDLSEAERCKWLFWNLHENLEGIRPMEPSLQARITSMQFTVHNGAASAAGEPLEKHLDLSCKWWLALHYPGLPDEMMYPIGEGWVHLQIANQVPAYLGLRGGQQAYLEADHLSYPNLLYLDGWILPEVWQEMRPHLSNPNPNCRSDIVLLDNVLFPVKTGFDFVVGPPASIGVMSMELRAFSHPTERRMSRRGEPYRRT